jgi:hypothetical protein
MSKLMVFQIGFFNLFLTNDRFHYWFFINHIDWSTIISRLSTWLAIILTISPKKNQNEQQFNLICT